MDRLLLCLNSLVFKFFIPLYYLKVIFVFFLNVPKILKNFKFSILVLSLFFGLAFASAPSGLTNLQQAMKSICGQIYNLLPPLSMLLVVAGAVVYAAGQFASAEMRARATGWATAMVIGALFAFVLVLLLPPIILALWASGSGNWMDYCSV